MNKRTIFFAAIFIILTCLLLLFSCEKESNNARNQNSRSTENKQDSLLNKSFVAADTKRAVALLIADIAHNSGGILSFTMETDKTMLIEGNFEGLKPGRYRIQLHQWGDCGSSGFTSTGPVLTSPAFNKNTPASDTIGNLGSITADKNGRAHLRTYSSQLSLSGINSIVGRSVVIHIDSAGASGSMISCGVIGLRL